MLKSRTWIAGWGVLGFMASLALAAPPRPEIERLVGQLGSSQFAEREQAARNLVAIGKAALEPLRRGLESADLEVRRRSQDLIRDIEKRAEVEQIIQPTLLNLDYRDQPVLDVVKDLAEKTGYRLEVQPTDQAKVAPRRVTLTGSKVPFWQAIDRLCTSAGLAHLPLTNPAPPPTLEPQIQFEGRGRRGPPLAPTVALPPPATDTPIVLADGQMPPLPTYYAGAVRVRVLPQAAAERANLARKGEAVVLLEVAPEPRVVWYNLVSVRVDQAVDAKERYLLQAIGDEELAAAAEPEIIIRRMGGGGRVVFQAQIGVNGRAAPFGFGPGIQQAPLRLKLPESSPAPITRLQGAIIGQAQVQAEPLLEIENFAQASGKTFQGKDGAEIRMIRTTPTLEGDIQVHLEVNPPNPFGAGVLPVQIQVQPLPPNGGFAPPVPASTAPGGNAQIMLQDANGRYHLPYKRNTTENLERGRRKNLLFLTFRPTDPSQPPTRLIYANSRVATVEIPFELRDIALAK